MPSILFVHENFPAQFGGIARFLARQGWTVVFATAAEHVPADGKDHVLIPGVHVVRYRRARDPSGQGHQYLTGTERAVLNGQAFSRLGAGLKKGGFEPDIVVAHSGWGSGSLARIVWPKARFVQYLEWWYHPQGDDLEPEAAQRRSEDDAARSLCRNLPFLLDAQSADAILVPTQFQASQIPAIYRPLIHVIHDGVDEAFFHPQQAGEDPFSAPNLPPNAPIVTYATRGMEPMRGFPQFMASWAMLQDRWPNLHCVIAGTDRACYGASLGDKDSYKARALRQHNFDPDRLHFVGHLPKPRYRALLQRSSAHVYLSRPFVLSWSLIEAMMTSAPLVTSRGAPVAEATPHGTSHPVSMDDPIAITEAVSRLLGDPASAQKMGASARQHALLTYASSRQWPKLKAFFQSVIDGSVSPSAMAPKRPMPNWVLVPSATEQTPEARPPN